MTSPVTREELSIAVQFHADLVLFSLAGPLDIYTVPGFRQEVDLYALAGDQIVIDLAETTLIDSAGLSALISVRNEAQRSGRRALGLVCAQRSVLRLLEITCLYQAFSVGPDLHAVRAALAK